MEKAIPEAFPCSFDPLDPRFWSEGWARAAQNSSLAKREISPERWTMFWNRISKDYLVRVGFESQWIEETVRMLLREEVVSEKSLVLDIGSGPGTFTLPLSRRVRHVVALDAAEKMLDALRMRAEEEGVTNITCLCKRWEACDFSKEFDLVFASFSQAIRSAESLLQMNRASRSYCCLVTASDDRHFRERNRLWELIFGEPFRSSSFHILYPFNYLYSCGFRPEVRFVEKKIRYEEPLAALIERYEEYFQMFTELTDPQKEKIRRYFEGRAEGGIVKACEERAFAIMWWRVER
ncbi:MAG: class I SAM-dependent methyltransferase [Desulfobacterota bacterium]|nr:class I SAM-dependent methyltransferase [Thermodesulfobacteriota bacterium]